MHAVYAATHEDLCVVFMTGRSRLGIKNRDVRTTCHMTVSGGRSTQGVSSHMVSHSVASVLYDRLLRKSCIHTAP